MGTFQVECVVRWVELIRDLFNNSYGLDSRMNVMSGGPIYKKFSIHITEIPTASGHCVAQWQNETNVPTWRKEQAWDRDKHPDIFLCCRQLFTIASPKKFVDLILLVKLNFINPLLYFSLTN